MRCSSLILLACAAWPAAAQGPALDARLAPDGRRVAFRALDGGTPRLFLRAIADTGTAGALALGAPGVEAYAWAPDGSRLVARGADGHLYVLPADGSPSRDLTPDVSGSARIAGFAGADAVMAMLPGAWDGAPDLVRIELASGRTTPVAANDGGITTWVTDADGVPRVAVREGEDGARELVRVRGDTITPMYVCPAGTLCEPRGFSADGRVWVRTGGSATPALILVDPITLADSVVRADLAGDPEAAFTSDSLFRHDRAVLADALPGAPLAFGPPTPDGARMLVTVPGPDGRVLYLFDRWSGTATRLMALAADQAPMALAAPAPVPAQLAPARLRYRITENDPAMPAVELRRQIERRGDDGRPSWRVTDRAEVPVYEAVAPDTADLADQGHLEADFAPPPAPRGTTEAVEVITLDGVTLRPLRRRVDGPRAVDLTFSATRVTGETEGGGFTTAVDVPLERAVWGDGAALALLVAALPLTDSTDVAVPVFDSEALETVVLRVTVTGGTAEAFRLAIRPARGEGPRQEWLVTRAAPHVLRRAVYRSGAFERTIELLDAEDRR